jgi:hypothetical protein
MELIIRPDDSFNKNEKENIIKIIFFAEKILNENNISITDFV